jgi:hypothetical protein
MKSGIATGGLGQLKRGQKELTMEAIEKKFAREIAATQPHQKPQIYRRMVDEFLKQKNHKPSASALW